MFDCKKCHHKCKAACCKAVPIEKEIYDRNKSKLVREHKIIQEFVVPNPFNDYKDTAMVCPMTEDLYCPFLNEDYSCNIYDDRPSICRRYGDESHPDLTCLYQAADGRERSRQEHRKLERECSKRTEKLLKIGT